MALPDDLIDYDGTTVALLEVLADRYRDDQASLRLTIDLLSSAEGHTATGATWLLRRWLEEGAKLGSSEVDAIAEQLGSIPTHWARLHLCQSISLIEIGNATKARFFDFLAAAVESERPFLRAWGTDGLVRLASQHEEYSDDARQAVERALADTSASVRARARRIVAETE